MQESVKPKYKNKKEEKQKNQKTAWWWDKDSHSRHTTNWEVELAGKDFLAWGLINYSLYLHFINVWVKIDLPHWFTGSVSYDIIIAVYTWFFY